MRHRQLSQGFVLPTVIITAVVMLGVLVAVLSMVTSTSSSLSTQYFEALAADAAESAASAAEVCLEGKMMTMSTVLKPNTDCTGAVVSGRSEYVLTANGTTRPYRTSYTAQLDSITSTSSIVKLTGIVERIRPNASAANMVYQTYTKTTMLASTRVIDASGDRPSQRWWYFGKRARLDFGTSGTSLPTAASMSPPNDPSQIAKEGVTVVSDYLGNVQFWSDGKTVWDKNGVSAVSGLNGGSSSTQAVVSFPLNRDRTSYAIVSNTGQAEDGPGQLYVSTINISADGTITATSMNTKLGSEATGYSYEALGAMPNSSGSGYYVYAYNVAVSGSTTVGTVYRYLLKINSSGTLDISPATKTVLTPAPAACDKMYQDSRPAMYGTGTFNFTQDYKRMILLVGSRGCSGSATGTAYLFSADSTTGNLTPQANWTTHGSGTGYSADFSPSGKYVYVSTIYPSYLARYNIQNLSAVQSSEWIIGSATKYDDSNPNPLLDVNNIPSAAAGGQIRRGPDGRMYIADRAPYQLTVTWGFEFVQSYMPELKCAISYIDKPDASTNSTSAIGLSLDAITLPSNGSDYSCSSWGLPQTVTVFRPHVTLY